MPGIDGSQQEPDRQQFVRKIDLDVEHYYAPYRAVPWMLGRKGLPAPIRHEPWTTVDIVDTGDCIEITSDLPGIDLQQLKISLVNNVLSIQGERVPPAPVQGNRVYRRERFHGRFTRDIVLPNTLKCDRASAEYSDGVLIIRLWKN